jgi:glucose-6-phosphate isomerase, archaeal
MALPPLSLNFDPATAVIPTFEPGNRWLSQLADCFADERAYQSMLTRGDQLVYGVTSLDMASGEGQLHYGLGILHPGKVGREYFMTRGHLHAWRPAAEVYICLQGQGMMLLEHETGATADVVPFSANSVVYVPGYTAHRTINVGTQPLVYWGVLSSEAGHDYEAIRDRNFSQVVIELDGQPRALPRKEYLKMLSERSA